MQYLVDGIIKLLRRHVEKLEQGAIGSPVNGTVRLDANSTHFLSMLPHSQDKVRFIRHGRHWQLYKMMMKIKTYKYNKCDLFCHQCYLPLRSRQRRRGDFTFDVGSRNNVVG